VVEAAQRPARVIGPGYRIQAELDERGWTQKDLAEVLGRPIQAVNEIIKGTKGITPETAIQLGSAIGPSAEFWVESESRYRLRLAQLQVEVPDVERRRRLYELAPITEMAHRRWIHPAATLAALEREVCAFFGINDPSETPVLPVVRPRKTANAIVDERPWRAWVRRAELLAGSQAPVRFDPARFRRGLAEIAALADEPEKVAQVPDALNALGVAIVFVPHLQRTYVDGAAFWSSKRPVVALSLRYDRLDYFWFTLAHELMHIKRNDTAGVVDEARPGESEPKTETAANTAAEDFLIPRHRLKMFLRESGPSPSRWQIETFAREIGRHPSIVVGRLQKDRTITFAQHRTMHVPVRPLLADRIDRSPD
jgi:HTH-type transcriptional regulator / antitoxin HigA